LLEFGSAVAIIVTPMIPLFEARLKRLSRVSGTREFDPRHFLDSPRSHANDDFS
jgi:hypothetical protein